jgi:hypothetical protein
MNILDQSVELAYSLLPKAKNNRNTKNKFFHFAFGYRKNKLIGIGQNNPEKTHTQAILLAKRFNTEDDEIYPYLHAETDLVSRLWGKYYIDSHLKIVVVRLNKRGQLRNSKPCEKCDLVLNALDINKIWWSTDNGFEQK